MGKIAVIAVVALLSLGGIGMRIAGVLALWAIGAIVFVSFMGFALVFYIVWKRPTLAVTEGTEVLQYHAALMLEAKGQPTIAFDSGKNSALGVTEAKDQNIAGEGSRG